MIGAFEPRDVGRRMALATIGAATGRPTRGTMRRDKILIVRPDHLGDLLFLTPALHRLRHGFPNATLVALVGGWGKAVLDHSQDVDRLITWDFPWFDRRPRGSAFGPYVSLGRLANQLREERFDLAIQFRADFWWGALAVRLAGIPEQVGYATPITSNLFTCAVSPIHGIHAATENLLLASKLTGIDGPESLSFPIIEGERDRAKRLIREIDRGRPIVALQVGAGSKVKLWSTARLAQVGRELRDRFNADIAVVGGPAETDLVARTLTDVGRNAIGLAGVTSLGELAAVFEHCALAVGPDSGPLHLAVAVKTPTVHLFGPADARRFGPYGDPARHVVIQSTWPCAPCNQLSFSENELAAHACMTEIDVDRVVQACGTLLESSTFQRSSE